MRWDDDQARITDADAEAALLAGAKTLQRIADRDVPVDTGALLASGQTVVNGDEAKVSYGDEDAWYAVPVHEDLSVSHPHGGAPKWLENAMTNNRGEVAAAIVEALQQEGVT